MKKNIAVTILLLMTLPLFSQRQFVATFDNLPLLQSDTFWNGSDSSGKFVSANFTFPNNFNNQWKSWDGWSYSNMNDTVTAGFGNQYSCMESGALNGTSNFAVCSGSPWVIMPRKMGITGTYVTNAAFASISIRNGDGIAKKFGGADGNDPDWFLLKAIGYDGGTISDSTEIYLADYRFANNDSDYVLDRWTWFDLQALGDVDSIQFVLSSTDNGQHGMNTPSYFCMDDFNGVSDLRPDISSRFDEFNFSNDTFYNGSDLAGGFVSGAAFYPNSYDRQWNAWSGWAVSNMHDTSDKTIANQYSTFREGFFGGSYQAIGFGNPSIRLGYGNSIVKPRPHAARLIFVSNTVFGYNAIKNGTAFSKKFGGPSGDDPDYFILNIVGFDYNNEVTDTIEVVLADYRFEDNSKDFILKDWANLPLDEMIENTSIVRLEFSFESSDTGQYGINTPKYFAMQEFNFLYSGVADLTVETMDIYPNPASKYVDLGQFKGGELYLYDMNGHQLEFQRTGSRIDIEHLPAGGYFLKGLMNENAYIGKFIKI